ncbi:MAG: LysR family transcriptional regulator [Lachnospiraceae bacterium]|jgi:DNA-binding transcriptional LysR family regulator|nr:LysR family transcriptional regulator [Lachnospiraceae bacterium]
MDAKDISIQKYMAFITTVECGSFTKAAEKLNYSQSGISRMIGDLEKEWKVTLLDRDRNGVSLTSDGQMLIPFAKDVVRDYRRLQEQVDELSGLKAGVIRIGTFSSVAAHWLPNIIREYRKAYPDIDYELLTGDYEEIEQWIREGRVDCGFLKLPAAADLESIFLEQDPYMAVLPEGHPRADAKKFPVKDFEKEPFLLLEHGRREEVSEFLQQQELSPEIRFTTWDDYAIMSMVESGLGISILPRLILRRIPYRVIAVPLSAPLTRNIGLVLKSSRSASLATRKFMEYLRFRG